LEGVGEGAAEVLNAPDREWIQRILAEIPDEH
jgi:hypothetical protein